MKTETLQKLAESLRAIDDAGAIAIRLSDKEWSVQMFAEDFLSAFGDEFTARQAKGHDGKPFWLAEHCAHGVQFTAVLPESEATSCSSHG